MANFATLSVAPVIWLKELKRTTKTARIGSLAVEICIQYFPNAQRERYTDNHALGLAAVVPRCHVDVLPKSCDDDTTGQ